MNSSIKTVNLLTLLNNSLVFVGVKFKDTSGNAIGSEYTYKCDIKGVKVGDEIVVDSPYSGMTVVTVSSIKNLTNLDLDAAYGYKWVVSVIDKEAFAAKVENDTVIAEQLAELQLRSQRARLTEDLAKQLGFDSVNDCEELKALLAKING